MVKNQQKSEGEKRVEEWVLSQGYPSMEAYEIEEKVVTLAWRLSLGDESGRDEYYRVLDEALAKGWNPNLIDGEQEVKMGWTLQEEAIAKYEKLHTVTE